MSFGTKTAIAFTLGLLIVGTVGLYSYLGIQEVEETNRSVAHTHEVIEDLEHFLAVLTDAETGQRGFILTGEEKYLEPYTSAAGNVEKDIDTVATLTSDNADQQQSIAQVRKLSHDKLAELQETIALCRQRGQEAALPIIRSDRGKRIMDELRGIIAQMEARERQLLDAQSKAAHEVVLHSSWTIAIGVLLSLLTLAVAAVIITQTMRLASRRTEAQPAGRQWPRIIVRYAFAVGMVALATGLRWWLEDKVGPMPLFITWYPAVLLVASLAGGGPGILATLLSVLAADYWFIEPVGQFGIVHTSDAVAAGIFFGTGIFLSILAERLRRARWEEAVSATQKEELALLNMGTLLSLDPGHRITHWSEGAHRLYGFSAEEARGKVTHDLFQTRFPQPLEQIRKTLFEQGYWEGELVRHRKDGTEITVVVLWALRRDDHGRPAAILEVSNDLTPQKVAEESLRQQSEELAQQNEELTQQSEELLRQTEELTQQSEELAATNEELQTQAEEIQALNITLGHREKTLQALLDSSRLFTSEEEAMGEICRAALAIMGQGADAAAVAEQQGDELQILAHAGFDSAAIPLTRPAKGSFAGLVIEQNRTACLEDTSRRPDLAVLQASGQDRFAAVLTSPLQLNGRAIGAVSLFSRSPQAWTAEQFKLIEWLAAQCSKVLEALRLRDEISKGQRQNEFLASIIERSSQAFGVGYPDGRLGLINKAFEELTGYTGDELRSIDWARTLTPPEWAETERRHLEELHRTGRPVRYEKEYLRKDGVRVPIELLVHMVTDAAGKPQYYYSFLTDITERKRAEEALHKMLTELQRSNRELEQFAYISSHDLQEPLRQVQSFVQLLQQRHQDKLDDQAAQYLQFVSEGATRMSDLVRSLLDYSRVGAREAPDAMIPCGQALGAAMANLQAAVGESQARITHDELPTVAGNLTHLTQLFQNLIGNAIKFRRDGLPPEIHVGVRREEGHWLFWVKDNGIGIDPQYHEKIFLIFQRLHDRGKYPGTGIGLAICKKIVEQHGGRIWIESKAGEGSTFYFTLPEEN